MTREFLKNLGLEGEAIDKILDENMADIGKEKGKATAAEGKLAAAQGELSALREQLGAAQGELETLKKSGGDLAALQKQLGELQTKYNDDTGALRTQLESRDYADAVNRAIGAKGLKFSSKSAQKAFTDALTARKLALKDGQLEGFEDFIKAQREADPEAFAPENPPPRFTTGAGGGNGQPPKAPSRAAQLAAEYHKSLYGETKKE